MGKRKFTIDLGKEKIEVEGHMHKNVAIKYLMKRRRSLLMTRDKEKVENLFKDVPKTISIVGGHLIKSYKINWEREGTTEFEGSRFVFTLTELPDKSVHTVAN
ncbi:MAG: hypothetical protein ACREA1_03395 [Nitrosotalea sp.]|uniref:Uncharacterized protein n=1 Tax=Nitrosotalea devaniterrae TaxID=1078905 RepID=A0A128A0C0_9ARCH|nr:conserved protein of unknown function [Candidatus Nitrosotalea devanaterra]